MATRESLPERVDIVIVGGGIMGASVAYYLSSRSNADIALLERDNVAAGSTGDSSANIRFNYGNHEVYTRLAWWSRNVFRSFEETIGHPLSYVECPRVRFGKAGTEEAEFIRSGYDVMRSLDIPTTKLDKRQLAETYPMFGNIRDFDFGIVEEAAAYSDGTDATNGFAKASAEQGVELFVGVSAEDFGVDDGEITSITTNRGTIKCDKAIICAGPWTQSLGEKLGVSIPITPTREEILLLDPPQEYKDEHLSRTPMYRFPGGEWYMRPDFGGGILVATHPYPDKRADPDNYRDRPDEETILNVLDMLSEHVPGLANSELKGGYCGIYSTTPDHDYIIDEAGAEGCYFVCGFSGHGFKHAPAVGKIVSDVIVDGSTDMVDLDLFSLDRFSRNEDGHGRPEEPL